MAAYDSPYPNPQLRAVSGYLHDVDRMLAGLLAYNTSYAPIRAAIGRLQQLRAYLSQFPGSTPVSAETHRQAREVLDEAQEAVNAYHRPVGYGQPRWRPRRVVDIDALRVGDTISLPDDAPYSGTLTGPDRGLATLAAPVTRDGPYRVLRWATGSVLLGPGTSIRVWEKL